MKGRPQKHEDGQRTFSTVIHGQAGALSSAIHGSFSFAAVSLRLAKSLDTGTDSEEQQLSSSVLGRNPNPPHV